MMKYDTFVGRLNELMSALGFDAELASWLSSMVVHHAGHVIQALATASPRPTAASAAR